MYFKLFSISFILLVCFSGCNKSDSEVVLEEPKDALIAEPNMETANLFLGSSYKLNTQAKNSSVSYNNGNISINNKTKKGVSTTSGSKDGTLTKVFTPNTTDSTYIQNYYYDNYVNEEYDEVCEEYKTHSYNGSKKCTGIYGEVINNRYYFDTKKCTYSKNYTYNSSIYYEGGTKEYNYKTNIRKKHYYTSYNENRSGYFYTYHYKKNDDTKTYEFAPTKGRWYFNDLKTYIEYDPNFDAVSNKRVIDLCNKSIYSGVTQLITKDNSRMRFTVISTNTVKVEKKLENETTWTEIGVFSKTK